MWIFRAIAHLLTLFSDSLVALSNSSPVPMSCLQDLFPAQAISTPR